MIFLFLALQAAASTPASPANWSALPPLRLSTTPDYAALKTRFVHDEVAAGVVQKAARGYIVGARRRPIAGIGRG
ncbi:MAG: hypothetical protein ABIR08_05685 [Sphingomonas sp.]